MTFSVVFDTNVLFSAIGWNGNPARCVDLVMNGRLRGLTCAEILEELAEKLSLKLAMDDRQIDTVIAALLTIFDVVAISGTLTGLQPDPDDDMILECAVSGNASHVVTGDRKHLLPLKEFRGAKIVTPAELLQLVESAPA
jgi:putative PIN family toxin of toxin-antitoxin system